MQKEASGHKHMPGKIISGITCNSAGHMNKTKARTDSVPLVISVSLKGLRTEATAALRSTQEIKEKLDGKLLNPVLIFEKLTDI